MWPGCVVTAVVVLKIATDDRRETAEFFSERLKSKQKDRSSIGQELKTRQTRIGRTLRARNPVTVAGHSLPYVVAAAAVL